MLLPRAPRRQLSAEALTFIPAQKSHTITAGAVNDQKWQHDLEAITEHIATPSPPCGRSRVGSQWAVSSRDAPNRGTPRGRSDSPTSSPPSPITTALAKDPTSSIAHPLLVLSTAVSSQSHKRHHRRPPRQRSPASRPSMTPNSASSFRFVLESGQRDRPAHDPAVRTRRRFENDEIQSQRKMNRSGGACMHCRTTHRTCDLLPKCYRCITEHRICVRNPEGLWLWNKLDPAARQLDWDHAVKAIRQSTFSNALLKAKALPGWLFIRNRNCAVLNVQINISAGSGTRIVLPLKNLFAILESQDDESCFAFLGHLSPIMSQRQRSDSFFPRSQGFQRETLRLVHQAESLVVLLQQLFHGQAHKTNAPVSAIQFLLFMLYATISKCLFHVAESLCEKIWSETLGTSNRGPSTIEASAEVRFALGAYFRLLQDIEDWEMTSLTCSIWADLQDHLPRIFLVCNEVFEKSRVPLTHDRHNHGPRSRGQMFDSRDWVRASDGAPFSGLLKHDQNFHTFLSAHIPRLPRHAALQIAVHLGDANNVPLRLGGISNGLFTLPSNGAYLDYVRLYLDEASGATLEEADLRDPTPAPDYGYLSPFRDPQSVAMSRSITSTSTTVTSDTGYFSHRHHGSTVGTAYTNDDAPSKMLWSSIHDYADDDL